MGAAVAITIAATVGVLAWVVAHGGLDGAKYRIVVEADGVSVRGEVPGYSIAEVIDFVQSLDLPAGSSVRGVPDGDRITLRFSEQVPAHLHQRLRNFLYLRR